MAIPWLMVGAGPHGVHVARSLIERAGVDPANIALLDEHETPLTRWLRQCAQVGMQTLRSPAAHHLDVPAHSLLRFAGQVDRARLAGRYRRPALDLFNRHALHVVGTLSACRYIQGRVTGLQASGNGYALRWRRSSSEAGTVEANRVVLATGPGAPAVPHWAGPGVQHVLAENFRRQAVANARCPAVVGTGLSGAQLALSLARPDRPVTLIGPTTPLSDFDSDPCFLGRRCLEHFQALPDAQSRRAVIDTARAPGSLPPIMAEALQRAVLDGRLRRIQARVNGWQDGLLHTDTDAAVRSDAVVLATGFEASPPLQPWLAQAAKTLSMPVDAHGTPLPDAQLAWRPGLYVTGRLAELVVGPAAPNIAGARLAARRICAGQTGPAGPKNYGV